MAAILFPSRRRRAPVRRRRVTRSRRFPSRRRRVVGRRRPRSSRVSARRILQVSSIKKHDTQLGSNSINITPVAADLNDGNNYFLWVPTYLPDYDEDVGESDFRRERSSVFFRGVRENVFISTAISLTWRRVCFWTHERLAVAKPIEAVPGPEGHIALRRPLVPFLPQAGQTDQVTGSILWPGTSGVDFTEDTRPSLRLDPQNVRVVYDKRTTLNPGFNVELPANRGHRLNTKRWHPVNRNLTYRTVERGSDERNPPNDEGWVNTGPTSPGNFYILDIFSSGVDTLPGTGQLIGSFNTQSTVYWHER